MPDQVSGRDSVEMHEVIILADADRTDIRDIARHDDRVSIVPVPEIAILLFSGC
jgi:hypothetical protein